MGGGGGAGVAIAAEITEAEIRRRNMAAMERLKQELHAATGRVADNATFAVATDTENPGHHVEWGINVKSDNMARRPWARRRYADMIVNGDKLYESRATASLSSRIGERVHIIRTGTGKRVNPDKRPAKAIGEVTIGVPCEVNKEQFDQMVEDHRVPPNSKFDRLLSR